MGDMMDSGIALEKCPTSTALTDELDCDVNADIDKTPDVPVNGQYFVNIQEKIRRVRKLEVDIQKKDAEIGYKIADIQERDAKLQEKEATIERMKEIIKKKDQELVEKSEEYWVIGVEKMARKLKKKD